jgi:hypothetical protein
MTPGRTLVSGGVGLIVLVVVFLLVALRSSTPVTSPGSAAVVIAIVTASAVAIERVIETFWTIIGRLNVAWLFGGMRSNQVDQFVDNLNETLKPFYNRAKAAAETVGAANHWGQDQIQEARSHVDTIENFVEVRLKPMAKEAPENQRLRSIVASVSDIVSNFKKSYPKLESTALIADQAIGTLTDFVGTFEDNPARRLISIYIGAVLGLLVAWWFGLDVFRAALEDSTSGAGGTPQWGIALTGLLMGLGSNPTHEVIRAIQEVKEARKGLRTPTPQG